MHIGPIFRALMHNKSRFWLITLEVALTLAIVVNCVNMMLDMRKDFVKPSGYDENNLLVVYTEPFAVDFAEEEFVDAVRQEDLRRLRAIPGVRNAAGIQQIPLSGSGSATTRRAEGSELDTIPTPYYVVTEGVLDTFGVELVAGRDFEASDFDYDEEAYEAGEPVLNVIISKKLANEFFPEENAVGKRIESDTGERHNTVIGVVDLMLCSWPDWDHSERTLLFAGKPGDRDSLRYMVRAEPGAIDSVYNELERVVRESNADRVITVRTLAEVKADKFRGQNGVFKLLSAVIFLLIGVTALGIVGLTAFSVTQRTRQIGTRRALGATKGDIIRYFLIENWIITGIGLIFGLGLSYALNYALVSFADGAKLDLWLMALGALSMWLTGVLAALAPAIRATAVPPEIATRTV